MANWSSTPTIDAWARRFSAVATGLAKHKVPVVIAKRGPAPGWTDGRRITVLERVVKDALSSTDRFISSKALIYHETSHLLWTPAPLDSEPYNSYVQDGAPIDALTWMSVNLLEDMRIESMFTTKYPVSIPWFHSLVANEVLGEVERVGGAMEVVWLWIAGRRYLPQEMLEMSKGLFAQAHGDTLACEVMDITAEMIGLRFPRDLDRVHSLIHRYREILDSVLPPNMHPDKAQGDVSSMASFEGNSAQSGEEISPGELAEILGAAGATSDALEEALNELIKRSAEELADDVADDMRKIRHNVDRWVGGGRSDQDLRSRQYDMPGSIGRMTHQRAMGEFQRLVERAAPMWHRQERTGRLRMQRVVRAAGRGRLDLTPFDRWSSGGDGADAEVVLLIDQSGSMRGNIHAVSQIAWGIKRACDDVNFTCSVIGYGGENEWTCHYLGEEPVGAQARILPANSGTDPHAALDEAAVIVEQSRKAHRLVIILTDGEWHGGSSYRPLGDRIRQAGGSTTVIDFEPGSTASSEARTRVVGGYGMDYYHHAGSVGEISRGFRSLISQTLLRDGKPS